MIRNPCLLIASAWNKWNICQKKNPSCICSTNPTNDHHFLCYLGWLRSNREWTASSLLFVPFDKVSVCIDLFNSWQVLFENNVCIIVRKLIHSIVNHFDSLRVDDKRRVDRLDSHRNDIERIALRDDDFDCLFIDCLGWCDVPFLVSIAIESAPQIDKLLVPILFHQIMRRYFNHVDLCPVDSLWKIKEMLIERQGPNARHVRLLPRTTFKRNNCVEWRIGKLGLGKASLQNFNRISAIRIKLEIVDGMQPLDGTLNDMVANQGHLHGVTGRKEENGATGSCLDWPILGRLCLAKVEWRWLEKVLCVLDHGTIRKWIENVFFNSSIVWLIVQIVGQDKSALDLRDLHKTMRISQDHEWKQLVAHCSKILGWHKTECNDKRLDGTCLGNPGENDEPTLGV